MTVSVSSQHLNVGFTSWLLVGFQLTFFVPNDRENNFIFFFRLFLYIYIFIYKNTAIYFFQVRHKFLSRPEFTDIYMYALQLDYIILHLRLITKDNWFDVE